MKWADLFYLHFLSIFLFVEFLYLTGGFTVASQSQSNPKKGVVVVAVGVVESSITVERD
jgi:hypothetical protein